MALGAQTTIVTNKSMQMQTIAIVAPGKEEEKWWMITKYLFERFYLTWQICQVPYPRPKFLKSCVILKNDDEKVWSRTNARVDVKDVGSTVSVKRGSKLSKEEEEKQDYYVNMGYAIRTLRKEFPDIFYRELSSDIY
ncbi:hypothetical protein J1N35_011935, partial [Gossypium stocksii]